eukprot:gene1243-biopygen6265
MSVIKKVGPEIACEIAALTNTILREGKWPEQWKCAADKPHWKKKGSKSDKTNYRPIALLPTISRVVERLIANQLKEHLRGILPKEQYGFRPKHSTEHALAQIVRLAGNALNSRSGKQAVCIASLDVASAFDTVDHELLLLKLERLCGISGVALDFFRNYLSDRKQYVKMSGDRKSSVKGIDPCGVPQGTVLDAPLDNLHN